MIKQNTTRKMLLAFFLAGIVVFGISSQFVRAENYQIVQAVRWGASDYEIGHKLAFHPSTSAVYVIGRYNNGPFGSSDVLLLKYDASLNLLWNQTWGGVSSDDSTDVKASSDGSAFVTGATQSWGAGNYDMFLLRYHPNGTLAWNKIWGTTVYDFATSLVLDEANDAIYVVGQTSSSGLQDLILTKFYMNGTYAWNVTWGGSFLEYPMGVILGNDGALYCAVNQQFTAGGTYDIGLVKFSTAGTKVWNVTWGHAGNDHAYGGLVQDVQGNIYVGGTVEALNFRNEFLLLKFNQTGGLLWTSIWAGDQGLNIIEDIALDATGNIHAIGRTNSFGASFTAWILIKYNPDGVRQWYLPYGETNDGIGRGIAVALNGDIYCAGYNQPIPGNTDIVTVRLSISPTDAPTDYTLVIMAGLGIGLAIVLVALIVVSQKYAKLKPKRKAE